MTLMRILCSAGLLVWLFGSAAYAQAPAPTPPIDPERTSVYGVGGVLSQQVLRTTSQPGPMDRPGPTIGFQFRTGREGKNAFVFEMMAQPLAARDRHVFGSSAYEDSVAPLYVLGGIELGRGRYTRLSVGLTTVSTVTAIGGVAIGFESTRSAVLAGAEFVVRVGGKPHALGLLAGLQLRLGGYAGEPPSR